MGSHFSLPNLLFLVKITIHRKMDAPSHPKGVWRSTTQVHIVFSMIDSNEPSGNKPAAFFQEIFVGLGFTTFVIFFVDLFFVNNPGKNHCFENWEGVLCCRFLFSGNRQLLYVWILIKQSQNTLSIFSQVYWPLWFCVQTSICSHVPYIDSFLPIFFCESVMAES